MTPNTMERAIERWSRAGGGAATLGGRFRTLHSAITWAVRNQLLVEYPLEGMSGPSHPAPRQHLRPGEVRRLIQTADEWVDKVAAAVAERPAAMTGWFTSELTRADLSWALLTGIIDQRLTLATAIADQLLTWRSTFADPLGP